MPIKHSSSRPAAKRPAGDFIGTVKVVTLFNGTSNAGTVVSIAIPLLRKLLQNGGKSLTVRSL